MDPEGLPDLPAGSAALLSFSPLGCELGRLRSAAAASGGVFSDLLAGLLEIAPLSVSGLATVSGCTAAFPFAETLAPRFEYQYHPPAPATINTTAANFSTSPKLELFSCCSPLEFIERVDPKFGACPSLDRVSTASGLSEYSAGLSSRRPATFASARVSVSADFGSSIAGRVSSGRVGKLSVSQPSSAFFSAGFVSNPPVCGTGLLAAELRASGSSHAGIFTSSAAKSKV